MHEPAPSVTIESLTEQLREADEIVQRQDATIVRMCRERMELLGVAMKMSEAVQTKNVAAWKKAGSDMGELLMRMHCGDAIEIEMQAGETIVHLLERAGRTVDFHDTPSADGSQPTQYVSSVEISPLANRAVRLAFIAKGVPLESERRLRGRPITVSDVIGGISIRLMLSQR